MLFDKHPLLPLLFDKDASGSIDKSEMMSTLAERGGGGVFDAARWSEADVNSDGSLSFKEVRACVCAITPMCPSNLSIRVAWHCCQFMWMFLSWVGVDEEEAAEAANEESGQAAAALPSTARCDSALNACARWWRRQQAPRRVGTHGPRQARRRAQARFW